MVKIFEKNNFSHEIANYGKNFISIFLGFFASINKMFVFGYFLLVEVLTPEATHIHHVYEYYWRFVLLAVNGKFDQTSKSLKIS